MKLKVSLNEKSINDAILRLEQAKMNLDTSLSAVTGYIAVAVMNEAIEKAPVCSGDLKDNLETNLAQIAVREGPDHVFTTEAVADVEAHTRAGRWRIRHRKALWYGEHYAAKVNADYDEISIGFMTSGVEEAKAAIPAFLQAVQL